MGVRLLALETATEACSAALWLDGAVIERHAFAPRRHAELLLPMVDALLAEAGIGRRALDAIAVGRGPGAFTGVRLAIAVAQGLALALDRPVLPVSTLMALAEAEWHAAGAAGADHAVLALLDARMGEVYAGAFARRGDAIVALMPEALVVPAALAPPAASAIGWRAVGSGVGPALAALEARLGERLLAKRPAALPRAASVARLGARVLAAGGGIDAAALEPVYLRNKVAQTLAEQGPG